MGVPRPIHFALGVVTLLAFSAATVCLSNAALAAEGPTLPPADFKGLPTGTEVIYDTRSYTVSRSEGFWVVQEQHKPERKFILTYAVFGKEGQKVYTNWRRNFKNYIDEKTKSDLERLWPLEVGKKVELNFDENILGMDLNDLRGWRVTLEVIGTEFLTINGSRYPTFVVKEHAIGDDRGQKNTAIEEYIDTHWYQPDAGLIFKTVRKWVRSVLEEQHNSYTLVEVKFPEGTTSHVLKGTKAP